MGKRIALVVCTIALGLLVVPAAFAEIQVTGIQPARAQAGFPVECIVYGRFQHPTGRAAELPEFTLVSGRTTIAGRTTGIDEATGSSAYVTFDVPADAPAGAYDVQASQARGITARIVDTAVLQGGFDVYDVPPSPTVLAISSIDPAQVWAGYVKDDITLRVYGTGFLADADVTFDGHVKPATMFVGATQLGLHLEAADIAVPKTIAVGAKNPMGGASTPTTVPLAVVAETSVPQVTISGADDGWHNAPVSLIFHATDAESGIQKIQYMSPPVSSTWTYGTTYTVPTTKQGLVTCHAQAVDWCNNAGTATVQVKIDITRPTPKILTKPMSVKRGKALTIDFRVNEPSDLSPTAAVTLRIKRANGATAKAWTFAAVPMNSDRHFTFTCMLLKGTYKVFEYATDLAGNTELQPDRGTLVVN